MTKSRRWVDRDDKVKDMKLLVVESPTKAKTIGKYLGNAFEVVATVGHLRDLPKSKMGVDLDKNFEVEYVVDPEKKKVVEALKKAAAKADQIILATDPDREGEAISWHVKEILEEKTESKSLKSKKSLAKADQPMAGKSNKEIKRIAFHEITKAAVEEALTQAREIDMDLVNAQQGRRVLDRVVGYSLSPVLWKKVRRGLSAGRVQSVAVRLICEREKEIEAFKSEKFYKINALLDKGFSAELTKIDGQKFSVITKLKLFDGEYSYSKTLFTTQEQVKTFLEKLTEKYVVEEIKGTETSRQPLPPYTTSKLQQAAARIFGWSGKQTMSVAQRLYERGLITYHRTDSVNLSSKAVDEFRAFIGQKYGQNYVYKTPRHYRNTSKNAQEAHEAIRPTEAARMTIETEDNRMRKLYELIWKRAVATQAANARLLTTKVTLSNSGAMFEAHGIQQLFDGFLRITGHEVEEQVLPELKEKQELLGKSEVLDQETKAPPRYSDASLVSSLEKQGIGRPSTYAPIISTILARQYVERDEGRFKPTALGTATNEFLSKNFHKIVDLPFTAAMEEDLDKVAAGKLDWKKMMADFWKDFKVEVKDVEKNSERVKVEAEKLGEKCPDCKEGDLVIRTGRFGKFISCSRFPECKYTRQYKESAGFKCPDCGGDAIIKRTKTGRKFYGCSNYPKCKWAGWKKP